MSWVESDKSPMDPHDSFYDNEQWLAHLKWDGTVKLRQRNKHEERVGYLYIDDLGKFIGDLEELYELQLFVHSKKVENR